MNFRERFKRAYDLFFSVSGLLLLVPLFALLAVAVKLQDGGGVFFRQERVGRFGRPFRIWKFRTMVLDAERYGLAITAEGDPRVTAVGKWLRRWKLDELPQLLNVAMGDMSLVGPRPEVPRYVASYSMAQRKVLEHRPGITDPATLEFRDEEALLARAEVPEKFYLEHCVPRKIELNLIYARQATLWGDTKVIFRTIFPFLERRVRRNSA